MNEISPVNHLNMCNTQMIEYLAPWVEYMVMGTLHSRIMQSSMSMIYRELLSRSANNEEHILWAICNKNFMKVASEKCVDVYVQK